MPAVVSVAVLPRGLNVASIKAKAPSSGVCGPVSQLRVLCGKNDQGSENILLQCIHYPRGGGGLRLRHKVYYFHSLKFARPFCVFVKKLQKEIKPPSLEFEH